MMTAFETIQAETVPTDNENNFPAEGRPQEGLNREITIHGSVHKIRKMSGFSFLILRTSDRLIQCVLDTGKCHVEGSLKEEACIRTKALVVAPFQNRLGASSDRNHGTFRTGGGNARGD